MKYIKSVLWRVAKCLSYIEEARCLKVKHNAVRACAEVDSQLNEFLTWALEGRDGSVSRLDRFIPGTDWLGGWVGLSCVCALQNSPEQP